MSHKLFSNNGIAYSGLMLLIISGFANFFLLKQNATMQDKLSNELIRSDSIISVQNIIEKELRSEGREISQLITPKLIYTFENKIIDKSE